MEYITIKLLWGFVWRNKVSNPCGLRQLAATSHRRPPHPLCHSIVNGHGSEHCHNQSEVSHSCPLVEKCWQLLGFYLFFFYFVPLSCSLFNLNENIYDKKRKNAGNTCTWPQKNSPAMALLMQPLQLHYNLLPYCYHPASCSNTTRAPRTLKALNPPHKPYPTSRQLSTVGLPIVGLGSSRWLFKWVGFLLAAGV